MQPPHPPVPLPPRVRQLQSRRRLSYSVELLKTPLGMGLTLGPNDAVTEISPDSQAARDGRIHVGDRVVSINGEMPTTAKPSSIILQGIAAGSTLKLELARKRRRKHKCREVGAREAGGDPPSRGPCTA